MQIIQRCLHAGPKILALFKKTAAKSERVTHESYIKLISLVAVYKASNKLKFYLFADDTNLLYSDRNLKSLESVLNAELLEFPIGLQQINHP